VGVRSIETGVWGAYQNVLTNLKDVKDQTVRDKVRSDTRLSTVQKKIYMSSYSAVACPEGKDRGIAPPNLPQIFKTYSKLIRTVFVYRYTASVGYFIFARMNVHRESKKQDTKLLAITSPTIIRYSKFFH